MEKEEKDYKQEIIKYLYNHLELIFTPYTNGVYNSPDPRYRNTNPNFEEQLEEFNKHYNAAKNEVENLERESLIIKGFNKNANQETYQLTPKFREELRDFNGNFRKYERVNNERKRQNEENERIAVQKAKQQEEKEHKKEKRQIRFNTVTTFIAVLGLLIQSVIGLYEVFKPEPKIIMHSTDSLLQYNIELLKNIDLKIGQLVKLQSIPIPGPPVKPNPGPPVKPNPGPPTNP